MKNTPSENPENFFQELTQPDYLNDTEIQDEYETIDDSAPRGLSAEQVSQIAQDSLRDATATSYQLPTLNMPFSSPEQSTQ